MSSMPEPTLIRLCTIEQYLYALEEKDVQMVSSQEIGRQLGEGAHNIRKDIGYIGETGITRKGYPVTKLKSKIQEALGLLVPRKACVVGLGRLGSALIHQDQTMPSGMRIVAGFDSNINKVESLSCPIPLYPIDELVQVVELQEIEIGIITVPGEAAQKTADQLVESGVRGIVNLAPVSVCTNQKGIVIRNSNILSEFKIVSAFMQKHEQTGNVKSNY